MKTQTVTKENVNKNDTYYIKDVKGLLVSNKHSQKSIAHPYMFDLLFIICYMLGGIGLEGIGITDPAAFGFYGFITCLIYTTFRVIK